MLHGLLDVGLFSSPTLRCQQLLKSVLWNNTPFLPECSNVPISQTAIKQVALSKDDRDRCGLQCAEWEGWE